MQCVIPAAGIGQRFFPISKAIPKEMLPLGDRPVIDHVIEHAREAGCEQVVIVSGSHKRAIQDYLSPSKPQSTEPTAPERRFRDLSFVFVDQGSTPGLGSAISAARPVINGAAFLVLLGDVVFLPGRPPVARRLMDDFERLKRPIISVESMPGDLLHNHGVAALEGFVDGLGRVKNLIEKPNVVTASEGWAISGGYVLTPHIFDHLEEIAPDSRGEKQLTDALKLEIEEGLFARQQDVPRLHISDPSSWLEANFVWAAQRGVETEEIRSIARRILSHDPGHWTRRVGATRDSAGHDRGRQG